MVHFSVDRKVSFRKPSSDALGVRFMSGKQHVLVVGAGPGGLTAGMLLQHYGYQVTILEKADRVGGRNARIDLGAYHFDTGPTFLMMKFILDEMFAAVGRKTEDYLHTTQLEPMYR
ncbi:MAG TPA: NAD(P)-binding protein, partial [Candidatus Cloacimonadota bacterium]|nr:NAD(P)-binding protein [Candidatus Cloacimonadota bacterium]